MPKRRVPVRAEPVAPPPDPPKKSWLEKFGGSKTESSSREPDAPGPEIESRPVSEPAPNPIRLTAKARVSNEAPRPSDPEPPPKLRRVPAAAKKERGPSASQAIVKRLFVKKDLRDPLEPRDEEPRLRRTLGPGTLVLLGIAGIIGTSIFVLTGTAARDLAGPAVVISFLLAGLIATLAAFAYAELSSMIPVSGGAYTYSYFGIGEIVAWIVGWNLVLEYGVGAMVVAQGWAGYVNGLLEQAGMGLEPQFLTGPLEGGVINLLAVLIVLAITALLVYGMQEAASVTNALVLVKLAVIGFVIFFGFTLVNDINYVPFVPSPVTTDADATVYGFSGIITAAGLVFFAYIGFDALSTTAEETRNPRRDLPIGILASLAVATALYVLVSLVLAGMEPYLNLDSRDPLARSFEDRGYAWAAALVRVGAAVGITGVLVVLLVAQPRIFYSMARDGLLPAMFARVHPKLRTPWVATIATGLVVALVAGLVPLAVLASVVNIGALFAFALVGVSVIVLRYKAPEATRGFRIPGPAWLLPGVGTLVSVVLMFALPRLTLLFFVLWTGVGLVLYAVYGYHKSRASNPASRVQAVALARVEEAGP